MIALERLLGPAAQVERRTWHLSLFQKRIVRVDGERYALHRFLDPRVAARLRWLLDECARNAVPLQRPVAWTRSAWQALKLGGYWVATGFVPGEPILGHGSPANLATLGKALARLHGIERDRPGTLFRARPPWYDWLSDLRKQLARGLAVGTGAGVEEAVPWLTAHGAFLTGLERYQLAHGDLYGANVLAAGNAVYLIDYEQTRFEPAGLELATALLRDLCGGRMELRATLLDAYLAACSPTVATLWEAHAPFYLVAAALRLADRREGRYRRLTRRGRDGGYARGEALHYAGWAHRLIAAQRAGAMGAPALLRQIE